MLCHSADEPSGYPRRRVLGDRVDGALLVFNVDDPSKAEAFARNDPYVVNGLVTNWSVRPWNVVIGDAG